MSRGAALVLLFGALVGPAAALQEAASGAAGAIQVRSDARYSPF